MLVAQGEVLLVHDLLDRNRPQLRVDPLAARIKEGDVDPLRVHVPLLEEEVHRPVDARLGEDGPLLGGVLVQLVLHAFEDPTRRRLLIITSSLNDGLGKEILAKGISINAVHLDHKKVLVV
eukprot:UN2821